MTDQDGRPLAKFVQTTPSHGARDTERTFTVQTKGRLGWRPFSEQYPDLFTAKESATKLAASVRVETRVTDSGGQVWTWLDKRAQEGGTASKPCPLL